MWWWRGASQSHMQYLHKLTRFTIDALNAGSIFCIILMPIGMKQLLINNSNMNVNYQAWYFMPIIYEDKKCRLGVYFAVYLISSCSSFTARGEILLHFFAWDLKARVGHNAFAGGCISACRAAGRAFATTILAANKKKHSYLYTITLSKRNGAGETSKRHAVLCARIMKFNETNCQLATYWNVVDWWWRKWRNCLVEYSAGKRRSWHLTLIMLLSWRRNVPC